MEQTMLSIIILIVIALVVVVAVILLAKSMYRIADVDKALIITGGKEPKIIISGGAFVIPIIRKADFFDLCMLTVPADEDEIMTKTAVPIIVDWTAQIRPDRRNQAQLETVILITLHSSINLRSRKLLISRLLRLIVLLVNVRL